MNRSEQQDPDSTVSYTVAWISALEEEYFCACRMLDEEFTGPEISEDNDDNTYIYGRIAKHYVVIGCLPTGRYGTNSAARVARDMVRTFPRLRFALMVGIGGGAPSPCNDVRLGDIVVSQPRDGFGGVIQYDLGKLKNGHFQKTGQLNAPPEKLLGVLPEIRRLHSDKRKPDRLAEHLRLLDDMEDYQKPAVDRLYATDYSHVDGPGCDECDMRAIVDRPERQNHRTIHVHYGTIASGNSVLKDAKVRDTYAQDPQLNILCFEMEAAGLMNNIPCLIIRGICDYCDSHKNDEWHNYAALVSAAYARELLLVLRPQRVDAMPPWAERVAQELQQVTQELTVLSNNQRLYRTALMKIEHMDQKIGLDKLPAVQEAEFDSFSDRDEIQCLQGTRTELLQQIKRWAITPSQKSIFWLKGMAGTGKSTISRTVAQSLKDTNRLGASFFFKRGEGYRGNAKRFFPTLTRQLMLRCSELAPGVQKALDDDPGIASKSLREQFEKLLLQPLLRLGQPSQQPQTAVVVIDALDECEHDQDIRTIIQLLPLLQKAKSVRLQIFLTSRPELPINLGFSEIRDHTYQDLALHEIPEEMAERDIHLFLQDRFTKIKHDRKLPQDWPGDDILQELVRISVPLFISAATVCRYIENSKLEPKSRLTELLRDQASYVSRMDRTYLPILTRLLDDQESDEFEQQQLLQEFQDIVGVIILLAIPLSINTLALFIGIGADQISNRLDSFRSVLSIPGDRDQPVRILHISFRDFLVRSRTKFLVNEPEKHKDIAIFCLKTMQNHLHKDICNLASPGTRRADIDPQTIHHYLPPELQYSCHYWIHHFKQSQALSSEIEDVRLFLQKHFLHWMEAMSLLGLISEVVVMLDLLLTYIPGDADSTLVDFLHDAKRFVLKNCQIVDEAPLQIYCAGLVFAPQTAIVRTEFKQDLPSWISQLPRVEDRWSAEVQALEGHTSLVWSVAFSPDGRLLASGSFDKTVRLWETKTGVLRQTLEGHVGPVWSVVFSPDGKLLASASGDKRVRLWNSATGVLQQILEGHKKCVRSVNFSPNSQLVASGSEDQTVHLWDSKTGALQKILQGHSAPVWSVAFSSDDRLLGSGSEDQTVLLWDADTGAILQTLQGHLGLVWSVVFSPNGRLLASSSEDKTVRVWDSATGALQHILEGHSDGVLSVAFSPDSRLLASGSFDKTVRLWDSVAGTLQQTLRSKSGSFPSVAFSPDGKLLASGSDKSHLHLWDTMIGAHQQTLDGHSKWIQSIVFSPDGRLLATGSNDKTICLWDTETGILRQTLQGHLDMVWSVVFSPNGGLLASSSEDKTVRVWDSAMGALQHILNGHTSLVRRVSFSPDGRLLASCSEDHTLRLWDSVTGVCQQTFKGHLDSVLSVAFSSDGRLLASGSRDRTARLWNSATGALLQTLEGHLDLVSSVTFSPDGQLLASGSFDKTVHLWDTGTGTLQQAYLTNTFITLRFSNDGSYLFTDLGALDIRSSCGITRPHSPHINGYISIDHQEWIKINGEKVLWLPPESRASSFMCYDNLLAIAHPSGRVSFIKFCI